MFGKIAMGALAGCVVLGISLGAAHKITISRAELGIEPDAAENCRPPVIPSFWRQMKGFPNYNGERVANYFGLYAAYASNAYTPSLAEKFDLDPELFGWSQDGSPINVAGGFQAHVLTKDTPDRLYVMVVFRGTDGVTSIPDLVSNASWFTQMINPWDQYRTARQVFQDVRLKALGKARGKAISYLAVGHSLGGGLARHIATAFPCTSAIVFNSSFVSNNFRLAEPYETQIVDVFEDDDPLSFASLYSKPAEFFRINKQHQWYRVYNVPAMLGQHGIFRAAGAMSRIPVRCLKRTDCEVNKTSDLEPGYTELSYPNGTPGVQNLLCRAAPPNIRNEMELCSGG